MPVLQIRTKNEMLTDDREIGKSDKLSLQVLHNHISSKLALETQKTKRGTKKERS